MNYNVWGRGVRETSSVYRIRLNSLGYCEHDATVRVGRTAIACVEATSRALAVRMVVERVRRLRRDGTLAALRGPVAS